MVHAAVCLTGMERSFAEVGANVREGLLHLLGDVHTVQHTVFFGVRPPSDSWSSVRKLLPLSDERLEVQTKCWSGAAQNATIAWMHCDFRLRGGDCRLSFLQAMCDLDRCEAMMAAYEAAHARTFELIVRLRADLFWEAAPRRPASLGADTVYAPAMDTQDGVNDHLAFGARAPMRKYLTRARHLERPGIARAIKGVGSEGFLGASLRWDTPRARAHIQCAHFATLHLPVHSSHEQLCELCTVCAWTSVVGTYRWDDVKIKRVQSWMYCSHTPRDLARHSASQGCVGRARCRVQCASLFCLNQGGKPGGCECLNVSCAVRANARDSSHGAPQRLPRGVCAVRVTDWLCGCALISHCRLCGLLCGAMHACGAGARERRGCGRARRRLGKQAEAARAAALHAARGQGQ